MRFTLTGPFIGGKNQIQISFRHGRIHKYPNKRFVAWRDNATKQIGQQPTLKGDVHMHVTYTPGDLIRRDVTGMLDALFHLLEHTGIVENDNQIKAIAWRTEPLQRKAGQVHIELEEAK
jgi:Holliday junction resolvase RusA-like endonuclease